MSDRCSCGRRKYPDADSCEECYRKGAVYDNPNDNNYCKCGKPKYPDATSCDDCWDRNSVYPDR